MPRRFFWTTTSFAHRRPDLPGARIAGPWLGRLFRREADPMQEAQRVALRQSEAERRREAMGQGADIPPQPTQHRSGSMVEEDQPRPVLKPSPALAGRVDAALFNARWAQEQRRSILAEAKARRTALLEVRADWSRAQSEITDLAREGASGARDDARREMFDAFHRAKGQHDTALAQSQETTRKARRFLTR